MTQDNYDTNRKYDETPVVGPVAQDRAEAPLTKYDIGQKVNSNPEINIKDLQKRADTPLKIVMRRHSRSNVRQHHGYNSGIDHPLSG
jgi:hypothetical protein